MWGEGTREPGPYVLFGKGHSGPPTVAGNEVQGETGVSGKTKRRGRKKRSGVWEVWGRGPESPKREVCH